MSDNESEIISIRNLSHRFRDKPALENLDLSIGTGELFGFLGHNGAGKTTTINILTTLLAPTSGDARVCGFDTVMDSIEVRRRIGYLPESVNFYDTLSAWDNLAFFARLSGIRNPDKAISETLEFIEFTGIEHKKLGEFSKGMRQRIGIAQAIMHHPEVLFLDEPTTGLDPMGIRKLREIILKLNRERNMTIFMNTHLLSEVAKVCTTIGVLNHGRLIYKDSLANTLKRFQDEASLEEIYSQMET
ncbi:MAG: ABC transporter ATP-binding protein [Thermoleophilia bacterium]